MNRAAYCKECDLGDLFSQEGARQTHQSVFGISRNVGIRRSSADRIIPCSFHSHAPRGKQRAY